jgi:RHS repeat-associated protein
VPAVPSCDELLDPIVTNASPHPGFHGHLYDPQTRLMAFGRRNYLPELGQFDAPEPLPFDVTRPTSTYGYAYANNNPIRFTDRTGLATWLEELLGREDVDCNLDPTSPDFGKDCHTRVERLLFLTRRHRYLQGSDRGFDQDLFLAKVIPGTEALNYPNEIAAWLDEFCGGAVRYLDAAALDEVLAGADLKAYGLELLASASCQSSGDVILLVGSSSGLVRPVALVVRAGARSTANVARATVAAARTSGRRAVTSNRTFGAGWRRLAPQGQRGSIEVWPSTGSAASKAAGDTSVYRSLNAAGETQYVGITRSFEQRAAAHLREKGIAIRKIPGMSNLSRADARAVEQVLIEHQGLGKNGGTLLNKINSIAESNPIYADSLRRGAELLRQAGYPGF